MKDIRLKIVLSTDNSDLLSFIVTKYKRKEKTKRHLLVYNMKQYIL